MSIVGALGSLGKLKPLLSGNNLEYLDLILTILRTPNTEAYNVFWTAFKKAVGENPQEHHNAAWNGLGALHKVVREQKGNFK